MRKLTIGSCFSGIGGIEYGLELTGGFETKWQCEINDYARKVLAKHWPGLPIYRDIKELYETDIPESVDVICGGFPCQPFSSAGKRQGEADERHLWPEFIRVIRQAKPRWVICENVPGLLTIDSGRPFGRILTDLASCGYAVEWDTISAASIGALHPRNRIFIIGRRMADTYEPMQRINPGAVSETKKEIRGSTESDISARCGEVLEDSGCRSRGNGIGRSIGGNGRWELDTGFGAKETIEITGPSSQPEVTSIPTFGWNDTGINVPNSEGAGQLRENKLENNQEDKRGRRGSDTAQSDTLFRVKPRTTTFWAIEPDVGRVANGIPRRMDRLKCLGNSVVPQILQYIGERILEHEPLNNQ